MNFSFLSSFFKKEQKQLFISDTPLLKTIKAVASANNLLVYENLTIFHHTHQFYIPLLILDTSRGLYIFEHKTWSYDEIKDAKIEKATEVESSANTLAFEKAHNIIRQKFNEIIHDDGVPIYNYLLMENLSTQDYENLPTSFQELLVENKVIFKDSTHAQIIMKIDNSSQALLNLPNASTIAGSLLIQYAIYDKGEDIQLCTEEQIKFIDSDISSHFTLSAKAATGKTSIVLLKALYEKLKNPKLKIIILKPSLLACEILKKKLLDTIEHAIVEIDPTSIEIITPMELVNKHLTKLSMPILQDRLIIDNSLMKKKADGSDLIICDDADLLPDEFISYLEHIQDKKSLILISEKNYNKTMTLEKSYRLTKQKITFFQTNPHAKSIHLISELLKTNLAKDILVISNTLSREKLNEDLESFIVDKAVLLDSSKSLIDQDINTLLLTTYNDIVGLNAKHIILMDTESVDDKKLFYAFELCDDQAYVLYEEESERIKELKEKYESN